MEHEKQLTRKSLEKLYSKYNHRKFVHPDPLEFLYNYKDSENREIVALIASSLAYGRVRQILKSVSIVLEVVEAPLAYVHTTSRSKMKRHFKDFKHRFTTGDEMAELLFGVGRVIDQYGSLGKCFANGIDLKDETVQGALGHFAHDLTAPMGHTRTSLVPNPEKGSACKRLNLLLRWMVRKDAVDPGGWERIDKSKLIIPLDTHMHRIALEHGLTKRKNADMRAALEITRAFARFSKSDPVRYDFALTRPGIGGH
ncbi:MAG: TIGR02757 family protein [Proteobacteria bacterium]|nr:TIGR02757 family protein [Pseudomonadota bacterium]